MDAARARLGGAFEPHPQLGAIVRLPSSAVGVVLAAEPGRLHVWLGRAQVTRVAPDAAGALDAEAPSEVLANASVVRGFIAMVAGDRVEFDAPTGRVRGRLVEKLRFGALLGLADGRVVAIGFAALRSEVPRTFEGDPLE